MKRTAPFLPREHGFWTMLAAVVLAAIVRAGGSLVVLLTAAGVVTCSALLGGLVRRRIRRSESLQLGSAVAMGFAGAPIQLAGGVDPFTIALTALAWAVVFASSALCVRASFARAGRGRRSKAELLQRAGELIPGLFAIMFLLAGSTAQAIAVLVASLGCIALGLAKPSTKQMKPVGIFLAAVAALAAVPLALF